VAGKTPFYTLTVAGDLDEAKATVATPFSRTLDSAAMSKMR
jgi:hypothetical protein